MTTLNSLEICAGAGGQALGLERAGFEHTATVEIDPAACATLRDNRPKWNVIGPPALSGDIRQLSGADFRGIDLLAGGVPCPPFSIAGKRLGEADERDLFPVAVDLIRDAKPQAVLLENVPGLSTTRFADYRRKVIADLSKLGYDVSWQRLNACNFGVAQLRPRFILVALRSVRAQRRFRWPEMVDTPPTVGQVLGDLMSSRGWPGAFAWSQGAQGIAPTVVGGSKKHGGPDLGPTRAKTAWRQLGVDGMGIANEPPGPEFPVAGLPRLTTRMVARLQGFPDEWRFSGKKTAAYRQIGNAFPPPVAEAVGRAIRNAIEGRGAITRPAQGTFSLRR